VEGSQMTMGAAASLRDPAAPSRENQVGQIYSDVSYRKWVRFQPTLTLKRERIRRRIYPGRDAARQDVFEYIEMFYNPVRRHGYTDRLSPVEFERRHTNRLECV
ncbi:MAG: IS3 family transposase, partial [Burkholderiaceae bacterium]|nr:IS3 family transposase [Burkholderiaceae bacterium]